MSKIEWTDITWNPVTGCNWISPGCDNCYASAMSKRLKGMGQEKYKNGFKVTCHYKELERDFGKKPKKIFVCSMGDLFHRNVPFNFIDKVLEVIENNPQHIFQILTKRPWVAVVFQEVMDRLWPKNVWFGVTAENQHQLKERGDSLFAINVKTCFLSIEPMLEKIVIPSEYFENGVLKWVIVGAETGPNARIMYPYWPRMIRDQCKNAGVPFFLKQMSKKRPIPSYLNIKQFPKPENEQ